MLPVFYVVDKTYIGMQKYWKEYKIGWINDSGLEWYPFILAHYITLYHPYIRSPKIPHLGK